MASNIKMEFYPLWMKENPELFEKRKAEFFEAAQVAKLGTIRDYWVGGLYYLEASV